MPDRRYLLALLLPTIGAAELVAQVSDGPTPKYVREPFEVAGRPAYVVKPRVRAAGKPWVWRARFPNFHTQLDQALLAQGYHVAYFNTAGMLGSDQALDLWDQFYDAMRARGFAPKVTLEAVSRGGLFAYRWAARHPERVACIYADTPVCTIHSWPLGKAGGQSKGRGHAATWQRLLTEYGLTDEEARAFDRNPIDPATLEPIAKASIPILHAVSENDTVVPPTENTYVLRDRLRALGHDMRVLSVAQGTVKSHGHHFAVPPEFTAEALDFVLRHTNPDPKLGDGPVHGVPFCQVRNGIRASLRRMGKGGPRRVAFLGGSITHNPGWTNQVGQHLSRLFPNAEFDFVNAGIPSMGSTPGAFRLQRDVLSTGTIDLLFVEAAVNDSTNGRSPAEMIRGMEGILRHVRRESPTTDIVMLHFVDPSKMRDYRKGRMPVVIEQHERVADRYRVPSIDLAREVTARIDQGEFTFRDDFRNLHPSPFGQLVYARAILRLIHHELAAAAEALPAKLPLPKAIDPHCYDRGALLSLDSAELAPSSSESGFRFVESWQPKDRAGTRPGFVNVPMLVATQPGSKLTLPFTGTAIGVWIAAGPDAGAVEWSIDGSPFERVDLLTRWSRGLHLPWAHVLTAGLPLGAHRLVLRSATGGGETRGSAVRIAAFLVSR